MADNYILNENIKIHHQHTEHGNMDFISVHQAVDQHGRVVKIWGAPVDLLEFHAWLSPPGPHHQLTQDLSDLPPLTVVSPPSQTFPLPAKSDTSITNGIH